MLALKPVLPWTLPMHNVLLFLLLLLLHLHQSSLPTNRTCFAFKLIKQTNHYLLHENNFSKQLPISSPISYIGNQLHSAVYQIHPLHLPWIHWLHWLHLILFESTPFLQPPHGHFLRFSVGPNLASHFISFVLPKFTLSSFHTLFPFLNLLQQQLLVPTIKTKSSAYSSSIGSLS